MKETFDAFPDKIFFFQKQTIRINSEDNLKVDNSCMCSRFIKLLLYYVLSIIHVVDLNKIETIIKQLLSYMCVMHSINH